MKLLHTLLLLAMAGPAKAAETTLTDAQGQPAWLYTPTDQPVPEKTYWLVIGVHGAGSDGKGAGGIASWAGEDVIVLGPSFVQPRREPGAPRPQGMPADSYQMAGTPHVDKLKTLIGEVGKTWKIHPRVFLHGFSAGAQFVHRFAMKEPQLVCGISAASAGTWSTIGFGEINPAAAGIPFAISCGEHDRGKAGPSAPWTRIEWMKEFAGALDEANFDVEARVIEGIAHAQNEDTFALAKSCFARARSLNFSRTALMAFDFNSTDPMWKLSSEASPSTAGVTAIATWDPDGGVVEKSGTSLATGALSLTVNSGPSAGGWHGSMDTGLIPVRSPESDPAKLTVAFDLNASTARPVEVRIESFNAAGERTGGMSGKIHPAAPDFFQRHVLDLGALAVSGEGTFKPQDPFLKITFRLSAENGWPAAAGNRIRVDNLSYAAPALYVSPGGDDANDGRSPEKPLATVQKAVFRARAGDVIMVMDGTYTSSGSIASIHGTGAPAAWMVLRSHPGHRPVFRSTWWDCIKIGQGTKGTPSTAPATAYIEMRGLTIQGYAKEVDAKYKDKVGKPEPETNGNGISINGRYQNEKPHHLRIADCTIFDCPGGGISAIQTDRTTIENNHTYDNCHWMIYAGSGISVYQGFNFEDTPDEYRILVRHNRSHGNYCTQPWEATGQISDGNGIIIDDMRNTQHGVHEKIGSYHGRILVQGNVSFRNGGSGMHAFSSDHVDFINNTTFGNNTVMDYGQMSITRCTDCRVLNNILVAPADKPINRVNGNSQRIILSHNLFWGGNGTSEPGRGPVMADPLFADAAAGDFRLKPDSPAFGKGGSWEMLPITYQDGLLRPATRPPDIGALPAVAERE